MTQHKSFALADFKAIGGDDSGEFTALVSTFGNVDLVGDRMVKGAFEKSLAEWREKGDPIPVIWNHMWENPHAHIGAIDPNQAEETDDGLLVHGKNDIDQPFAAQVHRLMVQRRIKEFSFGYVVRDSKPVKGGITELHAVDLLEVGPTLKGVNPETELLAVKAFRESEFAAVKAGARISKETRRAMQQAIDLLASLIATDDESADEPNKSLEAEAVGKASDVDEDIRTQIQLLKEQST